MASQAKNFWEYKAPLGDAVTGSLGANPFVSLLFGLDFEDPSGGSLTKIVVPWEGLNSEGHGTIRGHFLPSAGGVSGKVDSIEISIGSKSVFEVTFKPGITVKALLNALDNSDESDLSPIVNLLSKSPSEFSGSSGNDFAVLFNANDVLHGNGGSDQLIGGSGNDKLFGDGGKDELDGGKGTDKLTGGKGADTFDFIAGNGHDTVKDFSGKDKLDLTGIPSLLSETDALSHATEKNGNTTFDFGNGDILTILDASKADLAGHILT